jgi:hypothetical protein
MADTTIFEPMPVAQRQVKQQIEALGQAMLKEHGLFDWKVAAAREEDDMYYDDEISGHYGRAFLDETLIWVNMRYADDSVLVREILLHEIAHALLGEREGDSHDEVFRAKLREIGGDLNLLDRTHPLQTI